MDGAFTRLYIQNVFAVRGRINLLQKPWREQVFKYMSGIITKKNQKSLSLMG